VTLLAQTEVAEASEAVEAVEASEGGGEGRGGSSAMPHKRNPVGAIVVVACAQRAPGLVATALAAMVQEHERAAGAWQSEWEPLTELLRLVAAAAAQARRLLAELRVHPEKMAANVALTGGLVMAESAAGPLMAGLGRTEAQDLVARLCRRAVQEGTTLRAELLADPQVKAVLSEAEVVAATEPADYLGSAPAFIDRALAAHAELENP
jgi:3-carboxy-cis,cis-muconate cycloisomerase